MDLLIGSIMVAAAVASAFWLATEMQVRPLLEDDPFLHFVTVHLVTLSFLLLNVFVIAAGLRILGTEATALLFAFMMGVQVVAAIAAFLFARSVRRRKH